MTTRPQFLIITLASLTLIAGPLRAAESLYFTTDQLDPVAILPPPPAPGSAEEAVDLATTVAVHKACNPDDLAAAKSQGHFDVFVFAPVIGAFFQRDALPATYAFFHRVTKTADEIQGAAKTAFRRTRPYVLNPSLAEGQPENSYSYPSSHSCSGTVDALILADLFPEKRDDLLAFGRSIGWHRVQLGKHFPSDVYAGRVLALAIVRQLKTSPDFQHDFAAAKTELATAAADTHAAAPQPAPITPQLAPIAH
jgi:acid phosphatase (class A)